MTIELEFVSGKALRAAYRGATLDEKAVQSILTDNGEGAEWHLFERPGQTAEENGNREWTRSEDAFMAKLDNGSLVIVGSGWYRHLADPPRAETASGPAGAMSEPAENSETTATNAVPKPPHQDELVGFWRSRGSEHAAVALHVRENGDLSWIVFGDKERSTLNMRWKREDAAGETTCTLLQEPGESASKPRVMGRLAPESSGLLYWRAEGDDAKEPSVGARWGMKNRIVFERAASVPAWKAKAPAILPAKGDPKDEALRLLGKPAGTMTSGGREVLVYEWGNVWIANGAVFSVER